MPVEYLAAALGVDDARARRILGRAFTLIGREIPAELLAEPVAEEEAPAESADEEVPAEASAPEETAEEEAPAADSSAS
jgi:hypothetical protein